MNITRAAEILHVSQSTVSASMSNLEAALGTQLFLRSRGRPLVLTRAGRQLLTHARSILAIANELAVTGQESGAQLTGTLRVGFYETLSPFYMPTLVSRFQRAHPAVSLTFIEGDLTYLLTALREGECELALVYDWNLPQSIDSISLQSFPPYALVHAEHPFALAGRSAVSLAELAQDPLVLLDMPGNSAYFQLLLHSLGDVTISHRSSSYETVRSLVAAGQGFSILHQRPIGDRTYGGGYIYPLRLTDDLPTVDMSVVFGSGTNPTRKARAFIDMCRQVIGHHAAPESANPTTN